MPCCVVQCRTEWCNALLCRAMSCSVVQCFTESFSLQCFTESFNLNLESPTDGLPIATGHRSQPQVHCLAVSCTVLPCVVHCLAVCRAVSCRVSCSVLPCVVQCLAVCRAVSCRVSCSVLPCIAVCCRVLPRILKDVSRHASSLATRLGHTFRV